jgi:hypothetical protein
MKKDIRIEVSELEKGESFLLKPGGRGYTVHAHAKERFFDGLPSRAHSGQSYVIAVCQGVLYAFYTSKKVYRG